MREPIIQRRLLEQQNQVISSLVSRLEDNEARLMSNEKNLNMF